LDKIVTRKKRTFKTPFNDQKEQQTLFDESEYFITTPKFEELRKKILRGDFKKNV